MFIDFQPKDEIKRYKKLLTILANISRLSSDGKEPYIHYRMAEKVFCRSFQAQDHTRSDISVDVCKNNIGIGLKTFLLKNGKNMEKVAEFNKDSTMFHSESDITTTNNNKVKEIVNSVAKLRNARIDNSANILGIDSNTMIYHNVVRDCGRILICENMLSKININKIRDIKKIRNAIYFVDDINEYSFNLSKNTLFMRFIVKPVIEFNVVIAEDPFTVIESLFDVKDEILVDNNKYEYIILPFYSVRTGNVEERSGLNQWNAGGRDRNFDEVYLPIPAELRSKYPNFFPPQDKVFQLQLPRADGKVISVKICQQGGKALMSNPNSALGEWLLRDVLNLKKGELLTMSLLKTIGIDSVKLTKISYNDYKIDFTKIGSYDEFINNSLEDE